jgi:C4-dicarboxylate-specific signal transduction histidine kinase
LAGLRALQRQRTARERAEELLRLGQVARLNTMGELAAGMAHEVNQPLTAVIANAQAARRLLDDEPPDIATAREAMSQAAQQGRRAAEVVGRLRHAVERPDTAAQVRPVVLQDAVRNAFHLLEPEFARRDVAASLAGDAPVSVAAEPVALEQIVHNLLMNALQALDQVPAGERKLVVSAQVSQAEGVLRVTDSGRGIDPAVLPRVFEPFFSTRENGLGLGLSLCETLATGMGGRLQAASHAGRGAEFRLTLPLAAP